MCGIVGVINASKKYEVGARAAFIQALYADAVRGHHSTGVFKVEDNKVDWRKAAVSSSEFLELSEVGPFLAGIGATPFVVGHNRFATKGKVADENAHPFEDGHITLVHNGTLHQIWRLPDGFKYDVDSEAVCHAIRKQGIEETTPSLDGAYAFVWYDTKKKALNLLRNEERPLHIVQCEGGVTFFGSEKGLMEWVAQRNGYKILHSFELPIHEVWSYQEGGKKPKITKVKPYESKFKGVKNGFVEAFGDVFTDEKRNVGAVVPFQRASNNYETPFQRRGQRGTNYETPLPKLSEDKKFSVKVGETLLFSIDDFDDKVGGKFTPIVGSIPFKSQNECIIKGNYSGDLEILFSSKKLFSGVVSSIRDSSGANYKLIQIDVKEIKESEILDPFFMNDDEKIEWRKNQEKTDQTKKEDTFTAVCANNCGKNMNAGYIRVWQSGGSKMLCVDCYRKLHQPNAAIN